jgi:hypothetical protein
MVNVLQETIESQHKVLYNNLETLDKQRKLNSKKIFTELYKEEKW